MKPDLVVRAAAAADIEDAHAWYERARPGLGEQRRAWEEETGILRTALVGLEGTLCLEFDVPRLGSRIDAALVCGPAVFPIEFKCGEHRFTADAYNQAWDYGLDLKNVHQASHAAPIFPILVATRATVGDSAWPPPHDDGVRPPRRSNVADLRRAIQEASALVDGHCLGVGTGSLSADADDRRGCPCAVQPPYRRRDHAQRRRCQEPPGHLRTR